MLNGPDIRDLYLESNHWTYSRKKSFLSGLHISPESPMALQGLLKMSRITNQGRTLLPRTWDEIDRWALNTYVLFK